MLVTSATRQPDELRLHLPHDLQAASAPHTADLLTDPSDCGLLELWAGVVELLGFPLVSLLPVM